MPTTANTVHCRGCNAPIHGGFLCPACMRINLLSRSAEMATFCQTHGVAMETLAIVLYNATAQLSKLRHLAATHAWVSRDPQVQTLAERLDCCCASMVKVLSNVPPDVLLAIQTSRAAQPQASASEASQAASLSACFQTERRSRS